MADTAAPVTSGGAAPETQDGAVRGPGGHSKLDVQRLAEKVYALMAAEARMGHARTEPAATPRRTVED